MNKAFVRETEENDEEDSSDSDAPAIPKGQKNYMTPGGAKRMQEELHHLRFEERPEVCAVVQWAAGNGDRSENADYQYGKRRLREIDRRVRFLSKRLDNLEVVDPLRIPNKDQVMFGATVTIRDEDGEEKTYSIVGADEADASKGRISWMSPIGLALFKATVGDFISFKSPKGQRDIEVIAIQYIELP